MSWTGPTGDRDRTSRGWRRWTAFGLNLGAAAALTAGCRAPDSGYPTASVAPPPAVEPRTPAKPPTVHTVTWRTAAADADEPQAGKPDGKAPAKGKAVAPVVPPAPVPAPPAVPPAEADAVVDLGASLQLAGVGNPTIHLAREAVREALARQTAARALLLPNVNLGTNLHIHRGPLQASPGLIREVDSQSLYFGAGARTLAAESVAIPGVRLFSHLGDAAFEPLAARQRVAVRVSEEQAVQNQVLLDVATRYLELLGAFARVEALRASEVELAEVFRLTAAYAKTGQGRAGDANRAAVYADLFHRRTQQAEGEEAAASARLAELLSLDPATRLHPPPGAVRPVRLVDEEAELPALIDSALRNRPEIPAGLAAVAEAGTRVRQERVRPWLPTLSIGFSAGAFGGGSNLVPPDYGPFRGRTDFDVLAFWTFANAGVGNRALTRRASAVYGQAVAELDLAVNRIREEVAEAKARAQQAARQIDAATRSLSIAEEGFSLELARIRQGEGRPLEVLDGVRQLADARQGLVNAVIEFDIAQFRLLVALGCSPLAPAEPAAAAAPPPPLVPAVVAGPPQPQPK